MKFASFVTGFAGGYEKAKDKQYERERQAKDDAWRAEQQDWQRKDRAEKNALKTSMKDAMADRSTIEGTAVTGTTGTNFYKDPGQAKAMADEAQIEADMRGEGGAVLTQPATGVVGNMSKGHQITTGPVDLAAINSRDAKMARVSEALMASGDPEKAISMENTMMDSKAKKLGLDVAQLKFADDQFNRKLQETLSRGGDFWSNASQVLTDTNLGGLAGVQVKPVVSPDGKTVQLVGVKDGKEQVMFDAPNTAEGQYAFVKRMSKADPMTKISWLKEGVDSEAAKAKAAQDQANKDREFDQKARQLLEDKLYKNGLIGMYSQRATKSQYSGTPAGANLKDRNEVLSGFERLLPDPKNAPSEEASDQIRASNLIEMAKGDSIFQTNAEMGIALTSPQIMQAMILAKDQKNVTVKTDANTGLSVKMVNVSGRPVIVDVATGAAQKTPQAVDSVQPAQSVAQAKTTAQKSRGAFKSPNGQIQLLQPLFDLEATRKKMVEEANANASMTGM